MSNRKPSTATNSCTNSRTKPEKLPDLNIYHNTYHNPTKLLKAYRDVRLSLKLSMEQHQENFEAEYGMTITQYLDNIYAAGIEFKGTKLEHHANTMKRTARMLELIDKAAQLIKNHNSEGETAYWILYHAYFSPQKSKSLDEIIINIQTHVPFMTRDTYFKQRKKAIRLFSSVLWGFATKEEVDALDSFMPESIKQH